MIAALYVAAAVALAIPSPSPAPLPSPAASMTVAPSPAASPAPTASASPAVLLIDGQIVDYERGYLVFSSGDAFKLSQDAMVVDDATGAPPGYAIVPGLYAAAELDESSALVTSVRIAAHPLLGGTPAAQVPKQYVSVASPLVANPDLAPPPVRYVSKLSPDVLVTITVEVPADTPFGDDIYLTTDSSGWNAQAIKMQRIDGRHFRIIVHLKGGAQFHYLFTRGSWQSVERDRSGLARAARFLQVPGGDAMTVSLTVFRWADLP